MDSESNQNTQPTSPYPIADYHTRSPYAPPPPHKPSRRKFLWLLLLIPFVIVGVATIMMPSATSPIAVSVTATTAPTATASPLSVVPSAIPSTRVPTQAPTPPSSIQPTSIPTMTTPTTPAGGSVVVTISPTSVTITCGNATTMVTLMNPSATQSAHWAAITNPLYTLTPGNGTILPRGQQKMTIAHINQSGVVIVVSSGVSQTITITCNVGALAQNWESIHNA